MKITDLPALRDAVRAERAFELYQAIVDGDGDGDQMADAIEAAANDADVAMLVMMRLALEARGIEWESGTGVEFISAALTAKEALWTPST